MAIVGHNALLNQYVPTFFLKDLRDGQTVVFDAKRKAFVNADADSASGVNRLGELLDVADTVDNPLALREGQSLTYNSVTGQWENRFVDYDTLLNKPTSSDFSFAGLSDTATPPLADGYVKWNSTGTQLVYSTTIPAESITGLARVATTNDYNDLINKPILTNGTVTHVGFNNANGIVGAISNPTTTPVITIALENITPTSVTASGLVTGSNLSGINTGDETAASILTKLGITTLSGSNTGDETAASILTKLGITALSGTNTGDQTITLTGDVTGSGTGTFATTLSDTGVVAGTYGSGTSIPVFTVDSKGRIIEVSATSITLTTGTVTSVDVQGTAGIEVVGSPITTSGTVTVGLADTGVVAGVYGDAHMVPTVAVNSKGQITSISTQHVDTSVRDLVDTVETLVIAPRHQYIVTGSLEVDGRIENNGRIAIL